MFGGIVLILIGVASYLLILLAEYRRPLGGRAVYLSPAFLSISVIFLYFFVTGIVFLAVDPTFASNRSEEMNISFAHLNTALGAGICAIFGIYFGSRIGTIVKLPRPFNLLKSWLQNVSFRLENRPRRAIWMFILLSLIGIICEVVRQRAGFIHYGGAFSVAEKQYNRINLLLATGVFIGNVGYYGLVYYVVRFKLSGWPRLLAWTEMSILLLLVISKGGALGPLMIILPWLILFIYRPYFAPGGRKIPLLKSAVIAVIAFVLLAALKDLVRRAARSWSVDASVFGVLSIGPALFEEFDWQLVTTAVSNMLRTVSGIDIIAVSKDYIEQKGLLLGSSYTLIPVAIIPSLIWSAKPEISMTTWFHDEVYRTSYEISFLERGLQGNNFLLVGEAYLNFGMLGIPVIMFIYGFVLGCLARILIRDNPGVVHFMFLSAIFYDIVHPATTVAALFAGFVKACLILPTLLILVWLLAKVSGALQERPLAYR